MNQGAVMTRHYNPIFGTDSYKVTHWPQYPKGTQYIDSYYESRGGKWPFTEVFGLQPIMQKVFGTPITKEHIDRAEHRCALHFNNPNLFNRAGFERIVNKHGGYWPVKVRAVPEGMKIPNHNFLMGVKNTDPELPWVTNYLETRLCRAWYPFTVGTLSRYCFDIIKGHLERTGDPALAPFKLHDFGGRGGTCDESAEIAGAAHMVNFQGTDTLECLDFLTDYYGIEMAGFSIPASEHSTISTWMRDGKRQLGELAAYRNMITSYPTGPVACVSDTDDIYYAVEHLWGELLHDEVVNRDGVLIIRPDSGNPPEVVMKCLRILDAKFGSTLNGKGYRVLNPKVRLIQGDGVDPITIDMVYAVMAINGFSADNVGFGMGGALVQKVNRDDLMFAFKCCGIVIDGMQADPVTVENFNVTYYPVHKQPKTDPKKVSKSGPLTLYLNETDRSVYKDDYVTASPDLMGAARPGTDLCHTIYDTGDFPNQTDFDSVRRLAAA